MVIGNKLDLVSATPEKRKVPIEEVKHFCEKHNFLYNETSAKVGENVKEAFEELIERIECRLN